MSIVNITTHGDLTTPGSFRDSDLRIIRSDKMRAKLSFTETPPVALHFVNLPEPFLDVETLFRSNNVGFMNTARIEDAFQIRITPELNALTIVLIENEGADRMPLTPWMVAHRMAHALMMDRTTRMNQLHDRFFATMECICGHYASDKALPLPMYLMPKFFGTSRAARKHRILRFSEWFHESFAQWCMTGRITFKPALGSYTDYNMRYVLKHGITMHHIDVQLQRVAQDLSIHFFDHIEQHHGQMALL